MNANVVETSLPQTLFQGLRQAPLPVCAIEPQELEHCWLADDSNSSALEKREMVAPISTT
jgi:hypothetical protein